ncbi:MAG: RNA pseudouridine synthase, partial [Myxococcota bacterium]
DDFMIVQKAAGVPCAPSRPGETGTVVNALLHRYPGIRGIGFRPREAGLCHRLDNGTSGLLWVAKTAEAFEVARAALEAGEVDKRYLAVCRDPGGLQTGVISSAMRSVGKRVRSGPVESFDGWLGTTRYQVIRRGPGRVLVEASATRAFRHQIRVHLAELGAPLVGDTLYGGPAVDGFARHALHASRLRYQPLASGLRKRWALDVGSTLPADMAQLVVT